MISARQAIVTASAFVAMFVVFGVAYSFGAFFAAMGDELGSSAARTSAIFSITTFLFFLLGAVTGRISDRIGARPLLALAAASLAGGLLATARVQTIEAGYLTYGLGVGVAVAAAYVPSVATVGKWFEERRAAALGIAVTGIGVGTMVVSPMAASLIEAVGWRGAYRTMGWIGGSVLLLTAIGIGAKHSDTGTSPSRFGPRALRDRRALMLYLGSLGFSIALFVPFVFVPAYARSRGADPIAAAFLLGLLGLGSTVARLVLGPLTRPGSDRYASSGGASSSTLPAISSGSGPETPTQPWPHSSLSWGLPTAGSSHCQALSSPMPTVRQCWGRRLAPSTRQPRWEAWSDPRRPALSSTRREAMPQSSSPSPR